MTKTSVVYKYIAKKMKKKLEKMVLFVNTFIFGALGLLAFDLVVCCLDSDPAKLKKCDLLKCRNGNLNNVYMRHVAFATASNMKINFPK